MKGNQLWSYNHEKNRILHVISHKCLEMTHDGEELVMRECESDNLYQKWIFQGYDEKKMLEM
uniref:Ricin B lectin domain-containing protein n=1 Tax=Panagrolaimus sp. JU765 TaxID=591449 RepID=A0AC34QFJ4_9BILA